MKLRTKLLFSVGSLLVIMVVAIYLFLLYFIQKDILQSAKEIHDLIGENHEKLTHLSRELITNLSFQLFFVGLVVIVAALFILSKIATRMTKPIAELAEIAPKVAEGKYNEIVLPRVRRGRDEVAVLTRAFVGMVKGLEEREEIRGVLNKVVSKEVADEILKTKIHLGGEDRTVTMLFSDIRGFTQLTENLSPQQIITMLNAYMTKMSRILEGEGGVIDKYVGDEIMALFGAPTTHPDHAIRALSAAKLMIETLKQWNQERELQKEPPLEMGIGIHTGVVVAGNMGAEDRLNYTVIGANVNLAARLSQMAKPMQIIISEKTLEASHVRESFDVESLEPIFLKGFTDPVKIYQVVGFKW